MIDFAARMGLPWLQRIARDVTGPQLVHMALGRFILMGAIYVCVKPRLIEGSAANWLALLLVVVLAATNGFVATGVHMICMILC